MQRKLIDQLSFGLRANGLRMRRLLKDLRNGPPRLSNNRTERALDIDWSAIAGISRAPLWPSATAGEYRLTAGKIENLRLAVRRLNGLRIPAGTTFSFWRHVGRPIRARGFVPGRELREGCLVASIGGGLCQLSNGLYAAARAADCEIVERHRHSQVIPGSLAERDLDATVFWNYVDLRFRARQEILLEARLTATDLVICLRRRLEGEPAQAKDITLPLAAPEIRPATHDVAPKIRLATRPAVPGDCLTCGENSCVYHIRADDREHGTAWLLDAYWPEFDHWLQRRYQPQDAFHLPLDGQAWRRPNYGWHLPSGNRRHSHPLLTLMQAMKMRRLAAQGAARQRALLERDRRLAMAYASGLAYETGQLVVAQNLLPHLWESGVLGGRTYSVLMTRAPLADLQQTLDAAARLHPRSPTLGDFRAPDWLLAAEQSALQAARSFVTPHADLADRLTAQYDGTVERVAWHLPTARSAPGSGSESGPERDATGPSPASPMAGRRRLPGDNQQGRLILFAGASLARKGAYEMRDAARQLPARLRLLGGATEEADFWHGIDTEGLAPGGDPLAGVSCVVLPAFVEHQPRLLLRAVARGLPVICTRACGLGDHPGVTRITAGDPAALAAAITAAMAIRTVDVAAFPLADTREEAVS